MKVRNAVAEDERVDVLCVRDLPQDPGEAVYEAADCARFVLCEVTELWRVTLRLDDQPAAIRRGGCCSVDMTRVHKVVLIEDPALGRITATMLLADETRGRHFA